MAVCRKKTRSGAVYEVEFYPVPDGIKNARHSEPIPENIRTPEQKEEYNRHQSEKRFVRSVNTTFTSESFYDTLTYDDEHYPDSYYKAEKELEKYIRRLRYCNPNARIVAVTGYGSISGRLHHHLIIDGANDKDILRLWTNGKVAKHENLREHNYYNGVDYGEDFTALACYLHRHTPAGHRGKRWKQTKSIIKPVQDTAIAKRVNSEKNPPEAPEGFVLVEVRKCEYYASGYIYFKYVREVRGKLSIQPDFSRAGLTVGGLTVPAYTPSG